MFQCPFFMLSNAQNALILLSSFFTVIPMLIGLLLIIKSRKIIPIFYLVSVAFMFEIINYFSIKFNNRFSAYTSQFYTIIEFSLLLIYYITYYKKYFNSYLWYFLIPIYWGFSFYEFIFYQTNSIDSISIIIESIFFIVVGLLSFVFLVKYRINELITDIPFFWVNSGILVYFSGNILLFLFYKAIEPKDFFMLYVYLHSSLNIIYNILLCVSIYKLEKG